MHRRKWLPCTPRRLRTQAPLRARVPAAAQPVPAPNPDPSLEIAEGTGRHEGAHRTTRSGTEEPRGYRPCNIDVVAEPKSAPVGGSEIKAPAPTPTTASVDAAAQVRSGLPETPKPTEPFAYADWTWLNGNPRNKDVVWDSKFFTPEIRMDVHYVMDLNHPRDDTMGGSTEIFRSNEIQVE